MNLRAAVLVVVLVVAAVLLTNRTWSDKLSVKKPVVDRSFKPK